MKKYKNILTPSELQVMRCLWNAKEPLTGMQIAEGVQNNQKPLWKSKTIYPLLRSLIDKNMLRDAGSIRCGKSYSRLFSPKVSRPEYFALKIMDELPQAELTEFLSYFKTE